VRRHEQESMTSYRLCDTEDQECIRLLIADDVPRSRDGLRALLATVRLSTDLCRSQAQPQARTTDSAGERTLPRVEVVAEAPNGQEAVRLVEECCPDVVVMDARMPVMDGLEATRLIKSKWPEVKVIVLSLYSAYQAQALAAGADVFLIKGCPAEQLLEAVLECWREE
jgi:DNA-binding NarL/FixJ family response regulator